ncbi:S-adenosyl-L-methionine-dependent methyltransferase [Cercophora scortea]|uniref:S-adenosyl-L-methionine-dependent methyltransferase n=1 Tax=Cercophora scortea TaxID=314031 RepID=A0AAE0MI16_9PEZI|nr:S-adenosyl-L-methionine-dependent methyltransferase [Cercophora scortea]
MSSYASSDLVLVDLDWGSEINVAEGESEGDEDIEADSAQGSSPTASASNSVSLTSSIYQHSYHHGRRYQTFRSGRYPMPSDQIEQDREDMKHIMMLELTEGEYFLAPIDGGPKKIIDLGTGTGVWAIDIADKYPNARVTGVDLSPIQPAWAPPNVSFYIDDIEDEWLNGRGFDLVHARHVTPFVRDIPALLRKAYDHMAPGGWIELQDLGHEAHCDDLSMPENNEDYPVNHFLDTSCEVWADAAHGADLRVAPKLGCMLEEAGFVNVSCKTFKVPIGTWPKQPKLRTVGTYMQLAIDLAIPALCRAPGLTSQWTDEETAVYIAKCKQALEDDSVHSYMIFYFWQGQKPLAS